MLTKTVVYRDCELVDDEDILEYQIEASVDTHRGQWWVRIMQTDDVVWENWICTPKTSRVRVMAAALLQYAKDDV
jgi:hypothetical protein